MGSRDDDCTHNFTRKYSADFSGLPGGQEQEYAAIHEVTNGPFRAEESEFAPWSPASQVVVRLAY